MDGHLHGEIHDGRFGQIHLDHRRVQFALVRFAKISVLIAWCGADVGVVDRGCFLQRLAEVEELCRGYEHRITGHSMEEIEESLKELGIEEADLKHEPDLEHIRELNHHRPLPTPPPKEEVENAGFDQERQEAQKIETLQQSEPTIEAIEEKTTEPVIQDVAQAAEQLASQFPGFHLEDRADELELSREQVEFALEQFKKHDGDGNGILDKEELLELKKEISPDFPDEVLEGLIQRYMDDVHRDREGMTPRELLANFKDIFNEERKQLAAILREQHPGNIHLEAS